MNDFPWEEDEQDVDWGDEVIFDEDEITMVEKKEVKLDKVQRGVVDTVLDGDVTSLYLTGEGGSGKSAIIDQIVIKARALERRVLVLAPTNAAAKNIKGVTIHKAFGLNLEVNEDAVKEEDVHVVRLDAQKLENKFAELRIKPNDIIIIDEISMGGGMLAKVLKALRRFEGDRNGTLSTLMLVGDPNQLPPVKDKEVDWGKKCNTTVELLINYRTSNKELAKEILRFRNEGNEDIVERVPTVRNIRKTGYKKKTKYIAFKNATLSSLQTILLGDIADWVKHGDKVSVFGSSTEHHVEAINPLEGVLGEVPYFTNGDELIVISDAEPLPEKEYEGLFEIEVYNPSYKGLTIHKNSNFSPSTPVALTGDYKKYKKVLSQLFHPINEFKREMYDKYGVSTAKMLKPKMTPTEAREWGRLWSRYFYIKNRPFARHSNFVTAHKAQGQSIENVVVMWDEMVGNKLKYVAISRARETLTLVTRLSKN